MISEETPRLKEEAIAAIQARNDAANAAIASGLSTDASQRAIVLTLVRNSQRDVSALIAEVQRLRYELDAHKEHLRFAIQRAHAEKF